MTDPSSGALCPTAGNRRWVTRWTRRRVLLAGVTLAVLCGAVVLLRPVRPDPVVRTVTIGSVPFETLTIDAQRSRAFVFGRQDGTLDILDTQTGALRCTVRLSSGNVWLAVAERTGHVFVSGFETGTISTLDEESGALLHTVMDSSDMGLAVYEPAQRVYVGDSGGLIVLDARTGAPVGHVTVCSSEPFGVAVSARTGHVFAKCDEGTNAMLDARTGRLVRMTQTGIGPYCGLRVDEQTNRVFELGNPGLAILDARTGRLIRAWPRIVIQDCAQNGIAIDGQRGLVYGSLDGPGITLPNGDALGEIGVFDGRTGALLRRLRVRANPISVAVDARTGHVLVGSMGPMGGGVGSAGLPLGDGTVSVLDGPCGHLLRTLQVGMTPSNIVIDAVHRRALVLNSYSGLGGGASPVTWRPRESWWPQVLRRLKQVICCLPFQVLPPPGPTTNGTVTTIDLSGM